MQVSGIHMRLSGSQDLDHRAWQFALHSSKPPFRNGRDSPRQVGQVGSPSSAQEKRVE